jgi:hypothetical protein
MLFSVGSLHFSISKIVQDNFRTTLAYRLGPQVFGADAGLRFLHRLQQVLVGGLVHSGEGLGEGAYFIDLAVIQAAQDLAGDHYHEFIFRHGLHGGGTVDAAV